jgi:hypothetical protein
VPEAFDPLNGFNLALIPGNAGIRAKVVVLQAQRQRSAVAFHPNNLMAGQYGQ